MIAAGARNDARAPGVRLLDRLDGRVIRRLVIGVLLFAACARCSRARACGPGEPMPNHEHASQSPQLRYAFPVEWGTRIGLPVLALSFIATPAGWCPRTPLERPPQLWSQPVGDYVVATGTPTAGRCTRCIAVTCWGLRASRSRR
jgi:hypothetical protein